MDAPDASVPKVFENGWNGSIKNSVRLLIRIYTLTVTNRIKSERKDATNIIQLLPVGVI